MTVPEPLSPLPLRPVALKLDPVAIARIEALRDRLNQPTRGALLRFLVSEGLRAVETRLEDAGAETVIHTEP